jgi:ribosomal protein S18 acetylase RimI-like enzyme
MSEVPGNNPEIDRQPARVDEARLEDVLSIFEVERVTWMATYPSAEEGITEDAIRTLFVDETGEPLPDKIREWEQSINQSAATDDVAVFVARRDGVVVGFVAPDITDGQRRIRALYVLPEFQGEGVGGELMERALGWHGREEDIHLYVARYNKQAIDFYERFGFRLAEEHASSGRCEGIPEIKMVGKAAELRT